VRGGVAIAGRAGSGKSALAREVVTELQERGYSAQIVSFATALKEEVWELYGLRKGDPGSRETLIRHGEQRRADNPRYWVDRLEPFVSGLWREGVVPVCDDLRRRAEWLYLGGAGFYRVRVIAPEPARRARLTEQGLDPDFALSDDPTETDHEAWLFDRRVRVESPRDLRRAGSQIAARVIERGIIPPLDYVLEPG
jgi:hypothetical protein